MGSECVSTSPRRIVNWEHFVSTWGDQDLRQLGVSVGRTVGCSSETEGAAQRSQQLLPPEVKMDAPGVGVPGAGVPSAGVPGSRVGGQASTGVSAIGGTWWAGLRDVFRAVQRRMPATPVWCTHPQPIQYSSKASNQTKQMYRLEKQLRMPVQRFPLFPLKEEIATHYGANHPPR